MKYDVLDEYRRVFWKDMAWGVALESARKLEPYFGAWTVVRSTGLPHGMKARNESFPARD